jgi:hypothetical protein
LKREPSTAARALRAVSLVITLVTVVMVSTLAYSAYTDLSGTLSALSSGGGFGSGSSFAVSGNSATLNLNISIKNSGFFPLTISFGCHPDPNVPATCSVSTLDIPVGTTQVLPIILTVTDLSKLQAMLSGGTQLHFNATAEASLVPFATLTANFDIGSLLSGAVS